jgi:osmoprotectant transport system substrate-binding protein
MAFCPAVRIPPMKRAAVAGPVIGALFALCIAGCGASVITKPKSATDGPVSTTTTTTTAPLPGTGKPQVTIGDKNFTEQFVLGELYAEALTAQGYSVSVNRNIGPPSVTIPALESGRLDMYPEYVGTWAYVIAHHRGAFRNSAAAYVAGQQYAGLHGLRLLDPTPFSDTDAIAVTLAYAQTNGLRSIADLRKVGASLNLGGPVQFEQSSNGLPAIEQAYGFAPAGFTPLDIGSQYANLDNGTIQAADVNSTDGQLASGDYVALRDPHYVFGWGQVAPVVPEKVLAAEGPAFSATINSVTALLTTSVMRWLNGQVDIAHRDPGSVARQFLQTHGVIQPGSPS